MFGFKLQPVKKTPMLSFLPLPIFALHRFGKTVFGKIPTGEVFLLPLPT